MSSHGDLVEVYRGGGGDPRALMLKAALAGSGIESVIRAGWAGAQHPVNVGGMGEFALLVRQQDAARAREVLSDQE
ncbi:MAG: DUF2007 domain-containing protein [Actinomycetota bacterium]|nr:DUF2007 domain-containing protein [Actinomycetota bacterium]